MEESTLGGLLLVKFHLHWHKVSPVQSEKNLKFPLSDLNPAAIRSAHADGNYHGDRLLSCDVLSCVMMMTLLMTQTAKQDRRSARISQNERMMTALTATCGR